MLVLSRKLNQSIQIGDNISVSVVRIKGNVIQLGIEAPKDVHIVRSELLDKDAKATAKGQPIDQTLPTSISAKAVADTVQNQSHSTDTELETANALFIALRVISESPTLRPQVNSVRQANLTIVT